MRKSVLGILFLSTFVGNTFAYYSFFKSDNSKGQLQTCFDKDGCLDLKQRVRINVKDVPLGYLLSILSDRIGYPILLRCEDEQQKCYAMKISYYSSDKTLLQVIKEISALTGLYAKITPKGIVFYKYEEATFKIPLPPLSKDITLEDKGENKEDFLVRYKRDYLGKLEEKLKALLYSKNAKVSVSEKGYVFVRGTKEEVEAVKRAIEKITRNINREIRLRLTVLVVDDTKSLESGIDWQAILREKDPLTLSFTGLTTFGSQTYMSFTASGADIRNLLFQLTQGKNAIKFSQSSELRVLNGQPIYLAQLQRQRIISKYELSYVQVSTTQTQPTLSVNTEDIETGQKMLIVPYFVRGNTIAVDFVRKYNQLDDIIEKTVNLQGYTNQVALPKTTPMVSTGETILNPGESLVLVSNEITAEKLKNSGIPFLKDIPILGYLFKYAKKENRKLRVIVILTYEKP